MAPEHIAIGLGILSIVISGMALWISIGSDRRMKAIASLDFHEKLAVMASHLRTTKQDKTPLRTEQIRNDFAAATSLIQYVAKDKQERMIHDYIMPILRSYLSENLESSVAITVREIIDIALPYGIESEMLQDLRQRTRGFGHE